MSSTDQPYIDPSEIALEGSAAQRFKNRSDAFWTGIRDAAGAPAMVLFAGMVGFGAMGKTNGMDAWFTGATSFLMFALPGQVVLLEMAIIPQFHEKDRNHRLYASVHLLAMTAWAISMREFQAMEAKHRLSYFVGLGLLCWLISIPATILGYFLAGMVPAAITLGLVFINPLFFLLTFTEVKPWINRIAIGLGFVLGPFFFILDRDTSLLTTGLVAGTAAYFFDRKVLRKKAGVVS
jgi:predicted branched-subunit amino acid permease